jgi:lipoyltransferase/lipoate-protein ligase
MIYFHHSTSPDPYFNLALELTLLYQDWPVEQSELLLTYINRPAVVMGRFQNPWQEINLQYALEQNVSILRRMSGGGTVYHDEGVINFCVISSATDYSRSWALQNLVATMKDFGIELIENHRFDLYYRGAKVTGSAMRKTKDKTLHHFTLLAEGNYPRIAEILNHDNLHEGLLRPNASVASVKVPTTKLFSRKDWCPELSDSIRKRFVAQWSQFRKLQSYEVGPLLPEAKYQEQMQSIDWIFGETPDFNVVNKAGRELNIHKGHLINQGECLYRPKLWTLQQLVGLA